MKYPIYLLILLMSIVMPSCSDSDPVYYGAVTFHKTGLFANIDIDQAQTLSTTFSVHNVAWLEVETDELPDGWEVELEFYRGIVTVTATTEAITIAKEALSALESTNDEPNTGIVEEISFVGETHDGYSVEAILTVGVVEYVSLESSQANSMIVTKTGKFYTFNPTFAGEADMGHPISGVDDVEFVWRSMASPIRHVQRFETGEAGFYIAYDDGDYDDDEDYTEMVPGNAVLSAVNSAGTILWSWHIWMTEDDPTTGIVFNGKTFMTRNLGANMNVIQDSYRDEEDVQAEEIYQSYGLYYQWGRKDPFVQPLDYLSSGAYDLFMYDSDEATYASLITISYEDCTSSVGTINYAQKNPLTYIVGVSASGYDWLYSAHSTSLWSDDNKSVYDPSPKGWRVPRSADFEGVTVSNVPTNTYVYGATLSGSGSTADFMGCGRRVYINGEIQNNNSENKPWMGYYWTSGGTVDTKSKAFIFSNAELYGGSGNINTASAQLRANGMQIRCVKDE